ncbi:MAG: hypothetical protein HY320_04540 [Armatimonadetes bacterium]|nr:hypothetical protein [Armatimonadota bacterium]
MTHLRGLLVFTTCLCLGFGAGLVIRMRITAPARPEARPSPAPATPPPATASAVSPEKEQADPIQDLAADWQPPVLTPKRHSVILAFAQWRWGVYKAPFEFCSKGRQARVDVGFGKSISLREGHDPWDVLGRGLRALLYPGEELSGAQFYRDRRGRRLILLEGPCFATDTIILSSESRHPAHRMNRDFGRLRSDRGIGLGHTRGRVLQRLRSPSARYRFGRYEILWYLGKPRRVRCGDQRFLEGRTAAYALKKGRVVEIWVQCWSNERHG